MQTITLTQLYDQLATLYQDQAAIERIQLQLKAKEHELQSLRQELEFVQEHQLISLATKQATTLSEFASHLLTLRSRHPNTASFVRNTVGFIGPRPEPIVSLNAHDANSTQLVQHFLDAILPLITPSVFPTDPPLVAKQIRISMPESSPNAQTFLLINSDATQFSIGYNGHTRPQILACEPSLLLSLHAIQRIIPTTTPSPNAT